MVPICTRSIKYCICTSLFVRIIFVLDWCMPLVQAHQSIISRSIVWYLSRALSEYKYIGCLDDIQTALALTPLKKSGKKRKKMFMLILEQTEWLKTMYRPDLAWPDPPIWRSLTTYLSESIIDKDVKFWHNLDSILQFMLSKFRNNIRNYALFDNVTILEIFGSVLS